MRTTLFAPGRVTIVAALAVALGVAMGGTASAEPGQTDDGTTDAQVEVLSSISLTGLTEDFTLTGLPGATVTELSVVTFTVETNNIGGYAVTVQSQTPTLVAGIVTNLDSIPIGALSVRETGTTPFTALRSTAVAVVHNQTVRSDEGGDDLSNDYEVVVPFVNQDVYSATLDYIATTL